jgi:plasmid maintenance system antidote protein VapI
MARNVSWAVENDPAHVTPAVARELAKAVRNAAQAWCALTDRLEQSSSTEKDVRLDRGSDPADHAAAFSSA